MNVFYSGVSYGLSNTPLRASNANHMCFLDIEQIYIPETNV